LHLFLPVWILPYHILCDNDLFLLACQCVLECECAGWHRDHSCQARHLFLKANTRRATTSFSSRTLFEKGLPCALVKTSVTVEVLLDRAFVHTAAAIKKAD